MEWMRPPAKLGRNTLLGRLVPQLILLRLRNTEQADFLRSHVIILYESPDPIALKIEGLFIATLTRTSRKPNTILFQVHIPIC